MTLLDLIYQTKICDHTYSIYVRTDGKSKFSPFDDALFMSNQFVNGGLSDDWLEFLSCDKLNYWIDEWSCYDSELRGEACSELILFINHYGYFS